MLTGSTSLDLVRDELFTSMGEVEDLLQQFLEDRQNGSLLQQSIEGLQQLRGSAGGRAPWGGSTYVYTHRYTD